jgi:hypothetical protein
MKLLRFIMFSWVWADTAQWASGQMVRDLTYVRKCLYGREYMRKCCQAKHYVRKCF